VRKEGASTQGRKGREASKRGEKQRGGKERERVRRARGKRENEEERKKRKRASGGGPKKVREREKEGFALSPWRRVEWREIRTKDICFKIKTFAIFREIEHIH
jgi:hypothetical protein